jgi:hypothetical protein
VPTQTLVYGTQNLSRLIDSAGGYQTIRTDACLWAWHPVLSKELSKRAFLALHQDFHFRFAEVAGVETLATQVAFSKKS